MAGSSAAEGKEWLRRQLLDMQPTSILDVGAGSGTYRLLLGDALPNCTWTAVEAHEPYIERFGLRHLYDNVLCVDVNFLYYLPVPQHDVTIFGDVLEHMERAAAVRVWKVERATARKALLLSLPIVPYPQEALEGNEYERHRATWTHEQVLAELPGITDFALGTIVGVYRAAVESAA